MLPDKSGRVSVRSNFDGEVEICVRAGQSLYAGERLAVIEGDASIETLRTRKNSRVVEVLARSGAELPAGTLLLVLQELAETPDG